MAIVIVCLAFRKTFKNNFKKIQDIPMYYINLDKRNARRKNFEKQKKIHNLSIKRISAFDGNALPKKICPNILKGEYGLLDVSYRFLEKNL